MAGFAARLFEAHRPPTRLHWWWSHGIPTLSYDLPTYVEAATAAGALIYNEVLVQAAPWRENPPAFIDAFFYPKGSDPSSEAGETKTRAAYAAFTKKYPDSNVPLLVLDAAYPLHPTGNGPFTVAPAV